MLRQNLALLLMTTAAWLQPLSFGADQVPEPRDILWRDPGCVKCKDFRYGPGGAKLAPKPPFRFIEEDLGGSNPKVKVSDANGNTWIVKWGGEVRSESFSSRIAWAAGYYVRPAYFVKSGRILDVGKLGRAAKQIDAQGAFEDASFRLIPKDLVWIKDRSWSWIDNPFLHTLEGRHMLTGLKIVMLLTSNWDTKDARDQARGSNTAIYKTKKPARPAYVYSFDDWGATMGSWGTVWTRGKWDPVNFPKQTEKFVKAVSQDGAVEFGFDGTHEEDIRNGITTEDVSWIYRYLGQITDKQLRDGLTASGATPEEVSVFTLALRQRMNQLKEVAHLSSQSRSASMLKAHAAR